MQKLWHDFRMQPSRRMLVQGPAGQNDCSRAGFRRHLSLPGLFGCEVPGRTNKRFRKRAMRVPLLALIAIACVSSAQSEPTYSRDVSRIMQVKCQRCHRPNDIAPFPLTNYAEVSEWVHDIENAVRRASHAAVETCRRSRRVQGQLCPDRCRAADDPCMDKGGRSRGRSGRVTRANTQHGRMAVGRTGSNHRDAPGVHGSARPRYVPLLCHQHWSGGGSNTSRRFR